MTQKETENTRAGWRSVLPSRYGHETPDDLPQGPDAIEGGWWAQGAQARAGGPAWLLGQKISTAWLRCARLTRKASPAPPALPGPIRIGPAPDDLEIKIHWSCARSPTGKKPNLRQGWRLLGPTRTRPLAVKALAPTVVVMDRHQAAGRAGERRTLFHIEQCFRNSDSGGDPRPGR